VFTITFLARGDLSPSDVERLVDVTRRAGLRPASPDWLEPGVACDVPLGDWWAIAAPALRAAAPHVDLVVQRTAERGARLFVADMDSTMIAVECIDELAEYAGLKPQVAAITERAMQGELPFREALLARVALLRGISLDDLDACRRTRVRANPGARTLVATLRARGVHCLLVSGGFTAFAEPVAAELGFHDVVANVLEVGGGRLTGRVVGEIVDADAKRAALEAHAAHARVSRGAVLAVGDGANDLPMIKAAGLGVAYRAKPVLAEAADARLDHADLDALLHAIGIPRAEWVTD